MGQPATIVGTDSNDTIQGTHADDVIAALGGDDVISSGGSNDTDLICAGDGNDSIIVTTGGEGFFALDAAQVSGDAGDDRIQGAKGTFVDADYTGSPDPVTANLGTGQESGWGNDVLVNVTIVDGSPLDDTLIGSSRVDGLYAEAGNDTISGLAGSDWLGGGPGDDTLDGGPGRDWADYFDAPAGVTVRLAKGAATGGAGTDALHSIEQVFGSKRADLLVGGNGADHLEGYSGNDKLGGKGKDALIGGSGKDRADGGPARDVCRAEHKVHCP